MASILPGFEYDIFISYRHHDNLDGWVTDFVQHLEKELRGTIKDPVSIYFDTNPHDGLLETHNVDKSLEGKLKCLIFIPVISQTYCDAKSFAWQHEFCAFNRMASENPCGRDIKLSNGNVASRILPVKIHDLDAEDNALLESELGGVLRAIEFIFKSAGVNRPLRVVEEHPQDNQNKTFYRDQVNKVANAIKELIVGIRHAKDSPKETRNPPPRIPVAIGARKKSGWAAATIGILILLAFGYYYFTRPGNGISPAPDRSIAVLPFENMSKDRDQEYFSDGLTDEVLNRLFKIGGDLKVISRTSSMKFKGAKLTVKEIAGQLGVANILEGSVQKAGNRLKITVQLIDANTDNHLWSETYEREFIDIFSIQADIATAVAKELRIKLSPELKIDLAKRPTDSELAYEYFLKGRDYGSRYDLDSAILMYTNAIREDPKFELAYVRRIHAHLFRYWLRNPGWEEHKELGRLDIEVLKKLNPDLPELNLALADWHYHGFREYEKALAYLKESQIRIPNNPDLYSMRAAIFRRQGKWNESILEHQKAIILDPLNSATILELCFTYQLLHRYKDQLERAQTGLSLNPEFEAFRFQIISADINLGHDLATAIRESGVKKETISLIDVNFNRNFSTALEGIRKQGTQVTEDQAVYQPHTVALAKTYFLKGDYAMAKSYADSGIAFLKHKLPDMIHDHRVYISLGLCYAISGQEKMAMECGRKAMEIMPVSLDAWDGADTEKNIIDIYLYLGKYDLALDKIERLLWNPSELGIGDLLTDAKFEPLRNLPRFKKLVEKYQYKG